LPIVPSTFTPGWEDIKAVWAAGADVVAIDATDRVRPGGEELTALIDRAHTELGRHVDGRCRQRGQRAEGGGPWLRLGGNHAGMATRRRRPLVGLQPGICWRPCVPPSPEGAVLICEGGIATAGDARRANRLGADAVVVGTAITGVDLQVAAYVKTAGRLSESAHIIPGMPMPPMPGMPIPPIPPGEGGASGSALSAITTSVVINKAAIETASCRASRTTLAASRMPAAIRSSYSPVRALKPLPELSASATTTTPLAPAFIGDLAQGSREGALDDLGTGALIAVQPGDQTIKTGSQLQQGAAATGDNAFFDRRAGGVEGILNAQLAVAQFGFGGGPDLDDGPHLRPIWRSAH